jgi:hypothetical protein
MHDFWKIENILFKNWVEKSKTFQDIMNFFGKRLKIDMIKKRIEKDNLSIEHFTLKKSIIWNFDNELFNKSVEESNSFSELKNKLNCFTKNELLKERIKKDNLSITHFGTKKCMNGGNIIISNNEIFINNSNVSQGTLKNRIIKENLLEYKCSNDNCLLHKYNIQILIHPDKKIEVSLKLDLDHINGNNKDNRIENLRFLCPQCHSCTDTHNKNKLKEDNETENKENKIIKPLVDIDYSINFTEEEISKKTTIVWKLDRNIFKKYVEESKSFKDIREKIGKKVKYNVLKDRIAHENISIEHFTYSIRYGKQIKKKNDKYKLENILVENSTYSSSTELKKKLINENILENKCSNRKCICNIYNITKWTHPDKNIEVDLKLDLDHINGNHKDNRIENLRLLCRNCHRNTDTFCLGNQTFDPQISKEQLEKDMKLFKNNTKIAEKHNLCVETIRNYIEKYNLQDLYKEYKQKTKNDKPNNCSVCNCELKGRGKTDMCNKCVRASKSKCPTLEQLKKDIRIIKTKVGIGKKYGVSDNAVKKWMIKYELI